MGVKWMNLKRNERGFTLIELMVVLIISASWQPSPFQ
jgi:prepilin-type N-terminal cleavage/methylation domain-containing protein